jgi:Adenylate cyclase, family 3 (some proteins contain HAMP domain)
VGLRVGIHSGPVVGGVIGATRMAYDYWGETVNMAARLEGTAPVNGIAISESTWLRARDRADFGPPQTEMLKGVGETCVYHANAAPERTRLPEFNWVA